MLTVQSVLAIFPLERQTMFVLFVHYKQNLPSLNRKRKLDIIVKAINSDNLRI